jgi:hypothetical protein
MPADWSSFIKNVSDKLSSQSIKGPEDLADFLTKQYTSATVGKAQSPFGNTHQKGQDSIMLAAFSKGFKMLEEERSPTFQEKLLNPLYEKLDSPLPEINASDFVDKTDLDFKKWSVEQGAGIPDFTFSQLFDTFPKYPKDENELVDKLSDSILSKFDGSSGYLLWLNSLDTGYERDLGRKVLAKVNEKTKNILKRDLVVGDRVVATVSVAYDFYNSFNQGNRKDIEGTLVSIRTDLMGRKKYIIKIPNSYNYIEADEYSVVRLINPTDFSQYKSEVLTRKIFQESHYNNPQKIPSRYTEDFILKFTYVKGIDNNPSRYTYNYAFFGAQLKKERYAAEFRRNIDLKTKWVNEIADKYRNQEDPNKPEEDTEDPYEIIAGGIIAYWKSTVSRPLSANPPVPPCTLVPPGGGIYVPIYYGDKKSLANNLRRAFNTGKMLSNPIDKKTPAKLVAAALAFSFAKNLLELKFIYLGGIPSPGGPVPMVGFVPLVF